MRFVDISVDRFGVLRNTQFRDLDRGLTVVYGGNGSGKTTMVNFLRGLLFGYSTDHQAFQPTDSRFGGSLSFRAGDRSFRLTRERHGISSDLSKVDLSTGATQTSTSNELPAWINETVHREIFSVGDQEATRFDLLTRLCLDGEGTVGAEDEIRKAELAIEQCVREREGDGIEGGLRQKMSGLTQHCDELQRHLAELRRVDPTIPRRIAELEQQLVPLRANLASLEQQILEATTEIRRLEELLNVLRRRNVVALDRQHIEARIRELTAKQDRWSEIRRAVKRELAGADRHIATGCKVNDSLQSVRTLVSRLEQRMDALQNSDEGYPSQLNGINRDVFVDHMRSEVFSLCDYVTQHEAAVDAHAGALESLLSQRTLHDAENVSTILQGQIDGLQEELGRCDNVLRHSDESALNCESASHAEHRRSYVSDHRQHGTIAEIEAKLAEMQRRLADSEMHKRTLSEDIGGIERQLLQLRSQLKSAVRLEDVDRQQAEIASIQSQHKLDQERWEVLERTESHLRTAIDRLREYRAPGILDQASRYTKRLTDGHCFQLIANSTNSEILAETVQSDQPLRISQLSRGTRDQVALALRLALIAQRSTESVRCPLILDDVFITSDDERAAAVVDLLMEVASQGQQIIFFTCQNDVKALFSRKEANIRYLDEQPTAMPEPLPLATVVPPPPRPVLPAPVVPEPVMSSNTNWLYYLEVDNSVEDLSGLTVAEVEAFRASGLETIDRLLTASVDELESCFKNSGYGISRDRIRAWRGQAELATQIPMLRRSDAELLYAAGIHSTVELSRMRPENVHDMVTSFQNTQPGSRYRRSGRCVDRQQSINWSRWSQHSRSLSEARKSRSRYFVASDDSTPSPGYSSVRGSATQGTGVRQRRARISGSEGEASIRRQPRPNLSSQDERQRRQRLSQRRERLARHSSSCRNTSKSTGGRGGSERELRFYLNLSDDVEAAPSIGPRTAQRLGAASVYTVEDLLTANADKVAAKLDNRRVTVDTISQWQAQATLVCTVPQLRGHDAQILVACGITDPEDLAQKRPVDLFSIVGPFAETSEGERIVRGGKKPDLEEVTDWISWAQQSRSLKAAA